VQVDYLKGSVAYHEIINAKDGVWIWIKTQGSGEAVSTSGSGEVFKVNEINRTDRGNTVGMGFDNLIGNKGSHYIMTSLFDFATFEWKVLKTGCPGNYK
jgi:hypothetical protein